MKQTLGILLAFVMSLVVCFLWGRVFLLALLHPIRAFERLALPLIAFMLIVGLIGSLGRGRSRKTGFNARLAHAIQSKSTKELLEITIEGPDKWTEEALTAARSALRDRSTASMVEGIAELKGSQS